MSPSHKRSIEQQVTAGLVEKYIEPEENVILCVIPAMSDFGNAEAELLCDLNR